MNASAERPQAVGDRLDPVRLLHAQLAGTGDSGLAARVGGEERYERQFVDEARHLVGSDLRRHELARLHLHRRDRLAAYAAPVEDRDARTHALEHVEQPGAARVHAEIVDRDVTARDQSRRHEQRRRGREVARNDDLLEPQRARRLDGHRCRTPAHSGTRRVEQISIETALYLGLAKAVSRASRWFSSLRVRRTLDAACGSVLVALGLRVAAES